MDRAAAVKVGWAALLGILACGAVMAEEPEFVLGGNLNGSQTTPEARRVTLGSNLFVEPCNSCNYDSNACGYFVLGPDNCLVPGTTQWLGVPFIAAATGIPKQISVPIIVADPRDCPTRQVTLSIYTDACYSIGPGSPLVSAVARLPRATCNMGVAKLTNASPLIRGQNTGWWQRLTPTSPAWTPIGMPLIVLNMLSTLELDGRNLTAGHQLFWSKP